jgi:hypothetical protein
VSGVAGARATAAVVRRGARSKGSVTASPGAGLEFKCAGLEFKPSTGRSGGVAGSGKSSFASGISAAEAFCNWLCCCWPCVLFVLGAPWSSHPKSSSCSCCSSWALGAASALPRLPMRPRPARCCCMSTRRARRARCWSCWAAGAVCDAARAASAAATSAGSGPSGPWRFALCGLLAPPLLAPPLPVSTEVGVGGAGAQLAGGDAAREPSRRSLNRGPASPGRLTGPSSRASSSSYC